MQRFLIRGRYVSIAHEPRRFRRTNGGAELEVRLRARIAVTAGETDIESTLRVRFRKSDGWKFTAYEEAHD
jgi:hypothetical protein